MIYIGADHRGFKLKEKVAQWLFEHNHGFTDVGADAFDPDDDYTRYAEKVAALVADNAGSLGILICGSGVGVEVAANKFDGVRAGLGKNERQVAAGRKDDDMNILVLAADYTDENEAQDMVHAFIHTKFSGKERYEQRLEEIKRIEENN